MDTNNNTDKSQLSNIGHQIFNSELTKGIELRVLGTSEEPWFIAKDIAKMLDYKDCDQAVRVHIDTDYILTYSQYEKTRPVKNTGRILQGTTKLINESGLYSLILRSKNEKAKLFQKWVTSEVLPSIRKQGQYKLNIENQNLQLQLTQTEKEKNKYLSLYNQQTHKHYFHKFKKTGPCFYIITQGLEYADGICRIKIGICGCVKRKINKCPHCEEVLENNNKTMSFDWRLKDHRTLWPQLQVKFAVYTEDAELLERNMKRLYHKQINPGGHEIIEGVMLDEVVEKSFTFLNLFNAYSDKENLSYIIEDNIEKYNKNSITHMKIHTKDVIDEKEIHIEEIKEVIKEKEIHIEEIKEVIKEKEIHIEEIKEVIKEKEIQIEEIKWEIIEKKEGVRDMSIELGEYKKYLEKKIDEYKDVELGEILGKLKLSKTGKKQVKYDRLVKFIEEKIMEYYNEEEQKEVIVDNKEVEECDTKKRICKRPDNYQEFVNSLLCKRLTKYEMRNVEYKKDLKYCNGFCQNYCLESDFKKNNKFYMTICMKCSKMINIADIFVKNNIYTVDEIKKDISKIRIEKDEQMCIECHKIKKQYDFEGDRRQCKSCRYNTSISKVDKFDVGKVVEELKKDIKNISKYTKLEIYKIANYLNIKRAMVDRKDDIINKIKLYYNKVF